MRFLSMKRLAIALSVLWAGSSAQALADESTTVIHCAHTDLALEITGMNARRMSIRAKNAVKTDHLEKYLSDLLARSQTVYPRACLGDEPPEEVYSFHLTAVEYVDPEDALYFDYDGRGIGLFSIAIGFKDNRPVAAARIILHRVPENASDPIFTGVALWNSRFGKDDPQMTNLSGDQELYDELLTLDPDDYR